MSSVEAFKASHVWEMELRPEELLRAKADPLITQKLAALEAMGTGWTLRLNGVIIGSFGWMQLWPGVLEVWAFPSVHVDTHAVLYLRTVRRYLDETEKKERPHRMQTSSFADERHDKWMRFLGFGNETPWGMNKYSTAGETFNMWAKFPGGLL